MSSTLSIPTSLNPPSGGSTSGGGSYAPGTTATVTATPNGGYQFVNWTENGGQVSTSTSYSFTVSASRNIVANFIQVFTITTSSNPPAGGGASGGGSYTAGSLATVSATPNAGYQFVNWTENGGQVSTSASYSFTVSASRTLVANFTQSPVITTSSNPPAGGSTSGGGAYTPGSTATVTATPNSGYQFVNWTENGGQVSTSTSYSFTVSASRTLVANFTLNPVIATSSNPPAGGSTSGGGSYAPGTTATVTATPNSGYQFVNWTENGGQVSTSASYSFTVTASRTLVANFTLNPVIATSSNPPAGGSTSGGGSYAPGTTATVTAAPNGGYQFVNWTENGAVVSNSSSYSFTVTADRSLVANFVQTPVQYTITATAGACGTTTGSGTYDAGSTATVIATASSGCQFVNWTENGAPVSPSASYSFTVTSSRTLVANFTLNPVIATSANPPAGGSTSGGGSYVPGTTATVTATPNSGYQFVNWTENGAPVSTSASYSFTVTTSRTLVANFTLNPVIATSSNPPAGGSTSGGGSYAPGTTATVVATPSTCYQFTSWTENGAQVSTSASYSVTVNTSRTLVANFSLKSFAIAASSSPATGGSTSGGGTYLCGTTATLQATALPGYQFVNWTENGVQVSLSASISFAVTAARTLVANFSQQIVLDQAFVDRIVNYLLGTATALSTAERTWCDAQGNHNGTCDLGDLLALLDANPGVSLSPEALAALMNLSQTDAPSRGKE